MLFSDELLRLNAEASKGPFSDASYADIATNENLRRYLVFKLLKPNSDTPLTMHIDAGDLRARVLAEAERRRGSELWIYLFGVPAEIPVDEDDHRFAALLERLYLSAPGNYGKDVLFGEDAANRKARNDRVLRGALLVGAPPLSIVATGAICWLLVRRNKVRTDENKRSAVDALSHSSEFSIGRPHTR